MKINPLMYLLFVFAFSSTAFAQSIVITPKKTTYKRPKPLMDFKKNFTVTYPKVKAASPALSKKIETAISYQKNNNLNVKEEISEVQWLEEATYDVNYNKNGILDITLSVTGSGAYPSTYNETVVVNTKTGNRIRPQDVFTKLGGLAAMVKKAQQAEIKKAREEYKKDPESVDFDGSEYFSNANITVKNLEEFSVDDKGVTFIYDYGFPHVVLALQPEGRFFYSWAQLKPYIKPDGLLARFIR